MSSMISKPSFSEGKRISNSIKRIDKHLKNLLNFGDRYTDAVKSAANKLVMEEVDKVFKEMPIDELSRAKLGIRVQALKDAGIRYVGQVRNMSASRLEGINGIGPKSAASIRTAVSAIERSARDNTKLRIDTDSQSGVYDTLVKNLYMLRSARSVKEDVSEIYDLTHENVRKLQKNSLAARSWIVWSFSSDEKRAFAIQNLQALSQMLEGGYTQNANKLFEREQNVLKAKHDVYWGDFKRNAAGYYSTLENVRRGKNNKAELAKNQEIAVQNGLPQELAIAIGQISLDLKGLKKELRPYQEYGVQYILNQGAVLLGDEMGLGKTAQAIAAMTCLRNAGETHFFVVCPASVLINWSREVEDWCDIPGIVIHGDDALQEFCQWKIDGGIAITTYETLSKLPLDNDFKFSMLIVDEAHYVKNPKAARTQNIVYFRQHTTRALFMTGTPIENKVEEMVFLIGCLQPKIASQVYGSTSLAQAPDFRHKIASVYFRRTKEDVLDELPDKVEMEEWCRFNNEEIQLYRQYVYDGMFNSMRQVSWLISDPSISSKGERLREIIDEALEHNRKIIVFSFFLNTIQQVEKMLVCPKFGPITGSVSPQTRQEILDDFQNLEGGAVLLSQIQAGGTGLNIQAASVIIFCEPQLKPSIENQAIARAYRMGQVNTVMVHRLLCYKSVDERIVNLLKNKQQLFDNFADISESGQDSLMTNADIKSMIEKEKEMLISEN